jgi:hypothetical protein
LIKQSHHDEVVVTIGADGAVSLAMLLRTIRAMRGSRCPFPAKGEAEACLFFQTVVEAGCVERTRQHGKATVSDAG